MKLTPVMQKYILHWGEMGNSWGVNRTVSQVHALLYLADGPINAEEIAETLGVARSSVSTSVKELQSWSLIQTVRQMGERKESYTTTKDVWVLFNTIIEGRKQRELNPTMSVLRECVLELEADTHTPSDIKNRISEVLKFMEALDTWYMQIKSLPHSTLISIIKMGPKIQKFVGSKS